MSKTLSPVRKNGKSTKPSKNGSQPELVSLSAPTDELAPSAAPPQSQLDGVPYLGDTRKQALANAGIVTLDDLRRATAAEIGGVKGVGLGNAAKIKTWLEAQPVLDAPTSEVAVSPEIATTPDGLDPALASANQGVQDVFQKLGSAAAQLKDHLPTKTRDKALARQLDKLDTVASELAEGPDTLSAKQIQEAVKTLDKIAALLQTAAGAEKLSPKKQAVLIEELRARRKRLQKTLDELAILRYAVFSDIHGNLTALETVWSALEAVRLSEQTVLNAGDNVGYGDDPEGCVQFLRACPNIVTVQGNYDKNVAKFPERQAEYRKKWGLLRRDKYNALRQDSEAISVDTRHWLRDLPLEVALTLDSVPVLITHYAPGHKEGLGTWTPDSRLRELSETTTAKVVVCGHTHTPFVRDVGGILWINPGSLGRSFDDHLRYAVLTLEPGMSPTAELREAF